MKKKVDVLILTAFFGAGHYTVSKAIKEQALSKDDTINIELLDLFNLVNSKFDKYLYKLYNFMTKDTPELYNFFYNRKRDYKRNYQDEIAATIGLQKLSNYLKECEPKVIISTFPVCSTVVSKFKKKYNSNIPLITCITDVVDSWEWIKEGTDKYFVPTNEIKQKLINKGVNDDIINVTGIPVRRSFLDLNADSLNKENDLKRILIMGGGRGAFDIGTDFLHWLDSLKDTKVTIVTGTNEELYQNLNAKNFNKIKILGFVEDVASLMTKHDLLITKPGGVTLFEAINCQTPMIVQRPKIGQEIENANFIERSGIGIINDNQDEMKISIEELFHKSERIDTMKKSIFDIKKTLETSKVGDYVLEFIAN
ncbi:MAG: galactosyldiacylglycerol synthase [Peptostreptococcaceae bacterium]|nr:galactosyldiacylglycerol synthase [Peptostreptococcaceae bacterium]